MLVLSCSFWKWCCVAGAEYSSLLVVCVHMCSHEFFLFNFSLGLCFIFVGLAMPLISIWTVSPCRRIQSWRTVLICCSWKMAFLPRESWASASQQSTLRELVGRDGLGGTVPCARDKVPTWHGAITHWSSSRDIPACKHASQHHEFPCLLSLYRSSLDILLQK